MTFPAMVLPLLGGLGAGEIFFIVVAAILLFGPKKMPEMMRGLGKGVKQFKDALNKDYASEMFNPDDPAEKEKEKETEKDDKSA